MKKPLQIGTDVRRSFDYGSVDAPLADRAREAAERIRGHEKAASVEIGRELIAMKEALGHGHFIPWIEAELGYSHRTVVNLMQVATVFGDKYETVAHLPKAVLYSLAAPSTPDVVRESVLKTTPGKYVNPAEVKALIRKAKRPRPSRLTAEQQEAERKKAERERARDFKMAQQREEKREQQILAARDAVELISNQTGMDFDALRSLVELTTGDDLRAAILKLAPYSALHQAAE